MTTLDTLKVFLEGDASSFNRALAQASAAVDKHAARMKRMAEIDDKLGKGAARTAEKIIAAELRKEAAQKRAAAAAEKAAARAAAAAERAAKRIAAAQEKAAAKAAADGDFSRWVKGTATEINSVMSIIGRLGSAIGSVYKIAEEGARTAAAEQYFRNAGKSIQDFRQATHGLISDADLIKKSNLADTMGLTGEAFKMLAQVAHASASKTGQSFQHMLDSIILGTARESRLLLDNLGIIVNVTQARLDYAKSLKEGADGHLYASMTAKELAASLTDAAEKEAFLKAAADAGAGSLLEQNEIGETAADVFDRFAASAANLKTEIGKLVTSEGKGPLAMLATVLQSIADILGQINQYGMGSTFDFLKNFKDVVKENPLLAVTGAPGLMAAAGEAVARGPATAEQEARDKYQHSLETLAAAGISGETALETMANSAQNVEFVLRAYPDNIRQVIKQHKELAKAVGIVVDRAKVWGGATASEDGVPAGVDPDKWAEIQARKKKKATTAKEKAEATAEKIRKAYEKSMREYEKLVDEDIERIWREALVAQEAAWRKRKSNPENNLNGRSGLDFGDMSGAGSLDERAQRRSARDEQAAVLAGQIGQVGGLIQSLMGASAGGIGSAIGQMIAGPLGAAIGGLIGELLAPLQPVMNILGHVAQGVIGLLEKALGPVAQALYPLGPALEVLLNAVGLLIGSALAPLIPYLQAVVDGVVFVINAISWVITVLSPFVELIVWMSQTVIGLITTVMLFDTQLQGLVYGMETVTRAMIQSAIDFNNGFVRILRGIGRWLEDTTGNDFGLSRFGRTLSVDDFIAPIAAGLEDNTDATQENTRATRDLAQELRNLPQGYKINYALYNAQAPVGPVSRPGAGALTGRGLNSGGLNNSNFRRRT